MDNLKQCSIALSPAMRFVLISNQNLFEGLVEYEIWLNLIALVFEMTIVTDTIPKKCS